MKNNKHKAFTLVELIVVIAILAILGTIAFLSFQGYSSDARDGVRITDLKSIQKGLEVFSIKTGVYPDTENSLNITASGILIGYQGYFGNSASRVIDINKTPLDPIDNEKYIYSTNTNKSKYQLMSFLEGGSQSSIINPIYAIDYTKRIPKTLGDNLGILLDTNNTSISGTGVDIINTNTVYTMYFNNTEKITGTGIVLKSGVAGGWLIGYWDFDEASGSIVHDLSRNGNNSTFSGYSLPTWVSGKIGGGLHFTGSGHSVSGQSFVDMGRKEGFDNGMFTISFYVKSGMSPRTTGSLHWTNRYNTQIIKKHSSDIENQETFSFSWDHVQDEFKQACATNNSLNSWSAAKIKTTLLPNTWYHIVCTYNGKSLQAYLNGNLESSTKAIFPFMGKGSLFVGNGGANGLSPLGSSGSAFPGEIDELRVYNRSLSPFEIKVLYDTTK